MSRNPLKQKSLLLHKIKASSDAPGVYLMKDGKGQIIYVGKAKSLRKRILSYYNGAQDLKTQFLLKQVNDIELLITRSEDEALIIENELIKKYQPKYNINLKDGKSYPMLRLTADEFPRLFRTRQLIWDGSRYFGPYPQIADLDLALKVIDQLFPLRKCKKAMPHRQSPCLYFHIGRCPGVCVGKITESEYQARVAQICLLLEGDTQSLEQELEVKMRTAALHLHYEQAAVYRDQLEALKRLKHAALYHHGSELSEDYVGIATKDTFASLAVVKLKDGKIINREVFHTAIYNSPEELLFQFIWQYYARLKTKPQIIYLPLKIESNQIKILEKELALKIKLAQPDLASPELVKMAQLNAEQAMRISHFEGLVELKELLAMENVPEQIEAIDIAHLAGKYTVASVISFINGLRAPHLYRRYRLQTLKGEIDDYAAIREVVARRYMRQLAEGQKLPDLLLIDGGKGQLSSAHQILRQLGLGGVRVISLAKKHEEIYLDPLGSPLRLPQHSTALRLLVAVRDEAHRFATAYNRALRSKDLANSIISKVKGIGPKKASLLLTTFKSVENIVQQEAKTIASLIKVNEACAQRIINNLKELLSANQLG